MWKLWGRTHLTWSVETALKGSLLTISTISVTRLNHAKSLTSLTHRTEKRWAVDDCLNFICISTKCDGRVFNEVSGTISYSNYNDHAACRWEVHAPEGARIKVKIHSGSSFGIEHQNFCGNDKLSLGYVSDDGSKKLFGRICSSRNNPQTPFNGLDALYSPNGEKINSKKFREGTVLGEAVCFNKKLL